MQEVTRKRLMRRLETLPEEQVYQVLDFIEYLEAKYAREAARRPDAFQQFAERVEDQMRVRALAPVAMRGTMRVMSTAGKVLDGVRDLGRGLAAGSAAAAATATGPHPGPGQTGGEDDSPDSA
jgi:hypothetical protein